jgi:hypothetical protein
VFDAPKFRVIPSKIEGSDSVKPRASVRGYFRLCPTGCCIPALTCGVLPNNECANNECEYPAEPHASAWGLEQSPQHHAHSDFCLLTSDSSFSHASNHFPLSLAPKLTTHPLSSRQGVHVLNTLVTSARSTEPTKTGFLDKLRRVCE